jgi:DNA-binding transcriptional LysR family regulator
MEMRQLKSFVILAQELHFGRAAQRLHIVQPALSKQIKNLEQEIGCALLLRDRRSLRLSEAGRMFLIEAKQALAHAEQAIEAARRVGRGQLGRIRFGYSLSAVHSGVLHAILTLIEEKIPKVEVTFERVDPWQQNKRLLANDMDFVCGPRSVAYQSAELEMHCLSKVDIVLALSSKHRLVQQQALSLHDLKNETFIEYADSEEEGHAIVSHLLNIHSRAIMVRPDLMSVLALVQAGEGVCLLPTSLKLPEFPYVVYRRIQGDPQVQLMLTRRKNDDNPLLKALAEHLVAQVSSQSRPFDI